MADLSYPAAPLPSLAAIQGRESTRFTDARRLPHLLGTLETRQARPATGVITDQVVVKTSVGELPFASGRVWLLRLADGYKAWEGWSDAAGNYTATGLELGVEYIAVGIDPYRNQKATGAGPVTATLPTP